MTRELNFRPHQFYRSLIFDEFLSSIVKLITLSLEPIGEYNLLIIGVIKKHLYSWIKFLSTFFRLFFYITVKKSKVKYYNFYILFVYVIGRFKNLVNLILTCNKAEQR